MRLARQIFSFETLMVLFLTAGRFKADPRFDWVPVDLTALFFGLSIIAGAVIFFKRGKANRYALAISGAGIMFVAWICLSLLWTEGTDYAKQKAIYSATLLLWPLIGVSLIVAQEKARLLRLLVVFVIASTLVAVDTILLGITVGFGAVMIVLDGQHLGIGRVIGLSAGIVLVGSAAAPGRTLRIICFGLFFVFIFVLVFSGGKGPLVAIVAALLSPFIAQPLTSKSPLVKYGRNLMLVGIVAVFGTIVLVSSGMKLATIERAGIISDDRAIDNSTSERLFYYQTAWDHWKESPVIGKGIGSFPELLGRNDASAYPHNIFLEVGVETGIVGVSLFLFILLLGFYRLGLRGMYKDPYKMILMILFINTLVNAQFTEDLTGNRMLFAMTGLLLFGKTKQTLGQGNE